MSASRPDRRSKTLCRREGCGHPRSEHESSYDPVTRDYSYGKCLIFDCACKTCLEETAAEPEADRLAEKVNGFRCRICGSELSAQDSPDRDALLNEPPGHEPLGPECIERCERNWQELELWRSGSLETVAVTSKGAQSG